MLGIYTRDGCQYIQYTYTHKAELEENESSSENSNNAHDEFSM